METTSPSLWTLLHGKNLGKIALSVEGTEDRLAIFSFQKDDELILLKVHEKMLPYCHLFLFEGIVPLYGIPGRIKEVQFSTNDGLYAIKRPVLLRVKGANGIGPSSCDDIGLDTRIDRSTDYFPHRRSRSDFVEQLIFRRIFAFPKSISGTVISFRQRSLEPCYRMVESNKTGIVVRTMNSYD